MTTATTTNEDDAAHSARSEEEDIVEMDMEPEARKQPFLTPARARLGFILLAGGAVLALALALFALFAAPKNAVALLVSALIALAVIIALEVALLLLAKPEQR